MARKPPTSIGGLLADIYNHPGTYFPQLGKGAAGRSAAAATYLTYGPQLDALSALLTQSRDTYHQGVQSASRSGQAGAQGIQAIRDSYINRAGSTLGQLGGPSMTNQTPEARAANDLGLSGTALAGMLSGMAAQQLAGASNQKAQLGRQFQSDRSTIAGKVGSLLGQAGAYNTQQYDSLAAANAKERQTEAYQQQSLRTRLATAGINPDTGRYDPTLKPPKQPSVNKYGRTPAEWAAMSDAERRALIKSYSTANPKQAKPAPGTAGAATQADYNAYSKDFAKAQQLLQYTDPSMSDLDAFHLIMAGIPKGKNSPAVPGATDPAAAWAALQVHRYHGITNYVAGLLHQRGLTVKRLGYSHIQSGLAGIAGGSGGAR